jgi:ankyrin repeat protein
MLNQAATAKPHDEESKIRELRVLNALLAEKKINLPPHTIDPDTYLRLYELAWQEIRFDQSPQAYAQAKMFALKLMVAFGSYEHAVQFLERFDAYHPDKKKIIHDACLFSLPNSSTWTLSIWRELILNNKPHSPDHSIMRLFAFADKIETHLRENEIKIENEFVEKIATETREALSANFDHIVAKEPARFEEWRKNEIKKINKTTEKETNREFRRHLCSELNLPEGRLSKEDQTKLAQRKSELNDTDKKKKADIEQTVRAKYREVIAEIESLNLTADFSKAKQIYVKLSIQNAASTIRAKARDKAHILKGSTPISTLLEYTKTILYQRASENPEAARVFLEHDITENGFNRYLDLNPVDDFQLIPSVHIDGATICDAYKDYYITRLSSADPVAGVLGRLTSCCQRFDDHGEDCTVFGITNPRSGFYVLYKKSYSNSPDTIVAQTWAWRSEYLVFDSVESEIHFREKHGTMLCDFFTLLAQELVSNHDISRVMVGIGGHTPKKLGTLYPIRCEKLKSYTGFRDSYSQRIVADACLPIAQLYFHRHPVEQLSLRYSKLRTKLTEQNIIDWYDLSAMNGLPQQAHTYLELLLAESEAPTAFAKKRQSDLSDWLALNDCFDHHSNEKFYRDKDRIIDDIKRLVALKIHPDIFDKSKAQWPLTFSLTKCSEWQMVYWLLDNGADVNLGDESQDSLVMRAARSHSWEAVKILIQKYSANIERMDHRGRNVLLIACEYENWEMVKWLVDQGADLNQFDRNGRSPLYHAITQGDLEMLLYLLRHGANADFRSIDSKFGLLHITCDIYIQVNIDTRIEMIKALIASGANVNAAKFNGETPLATATTYAMKQNGSDIEMSWHMVELLIENGANFNAPLVKRESYITRSSKNKSILEHLIFTEQWKIVQLCLKRDPKAIFAKQQGKNRTSLLRELVLDHNQNVSLLLDKETINEKDTAGITALHYAVIYDKLNLVKELIALGADIEIAHFSGKSVLELAQSDPVRELLQSAIRSESSITSVKTTLFYSDISSSSESNESTNQLSVFTKLSH